MTPFEAFWARTMDNLKSLAIIVAVMSLLLLAFMGPIAMGIVKFLAFWKVAFS